MTDFVLNARLDMEKLPNEDFRETISRRGVLIESMFNYANFLKQPLELGMFVPCDEDGNILEEPDCNLDIRMVEMKEYQQAKERCLFEKSKYGMGTIKEIIKCSKIIEDLITCSKLELQLTQTAIKQIGL